MNHEAGLTRGVQLHRHISGRVFRQAGYVIRAEIHRPHTLQNAVTTLVGPNCTDKQDLMAELACVSREVEGSTAQVFCLSDYVPQHLADTDDLHETRKRYWLISATNTPKGSRLNDPKTGCGFAL